MIKEVKHNEFNVMLANENHFVFAQQICDEMALSAKQRGTGISKRCPEQIIEKITEGHAIIAVTEEGEWAGFCYIHAWENTQYVSNSGLIVAPKFRQNGLARIIKKQIFELSRKKYPQAKIFGLTTGAAVMKINSQLGFVPVIYSEITKDDNFWGGCKSCINFDILQNKQRKNCLCTAMLFDPCTLKKSASHSLVLTSSWQ